MKGSREPETAQDQQCSNCGLWYSKRGINSHEANCDHPEWAEPMVPLEGETEGGNPPTEREGPQATPAPDDVGTSPAPDAAVDTDGGPKTPPTFEAGDDKQHDGDDVQEENDDLGDRYVPVEDYLEAFEEQNPETAQTEDYREWKRDLKSRIDVVDVEATDGTKVRGATREEVAA
jgi:hypothetical protein